MVVGYALTQLAFVMILSSSITVGSGKPTFPLPSHCPTSCANITFFYPFGIGEGCYRQGFQLECHANTNQLFLANTTIQVIHFNVDDYYYHSLSIKSPVATLSVDATSDNIAFIHLKPNSPYTFYLAGRDSSGGEFDGDSLKVWVIGCSGIAYLVDDDTNKTIGMCSTICPATSNAMQVLEKNDVTQETCQGIGCCSINFRRSNVTSVSVHLQRIDSANSPLENSTEITAFISDHSSFTFNDIFGLNRSQNYVTASLYWYMNDEANCVEAMKNNDTYACISSDSECANITTKFLRNYPDSSFATWSGYSCTCSVDRYYIVKGNPYLPNGCPGKNITTIPTDSCSRRCGSIDIPFPFGVEDHCYRHIDFSLRCENYTSKPPALLMYNEMQVAKIVLDESMIELRSLETSYYDIFDSDE